MGPPSPSDNSVVRGAELLKVLANPTRIGIILELEREGELCVHELSDTLGISQPLASQHLRQLREAKLIVGRRDGKEIRYTIADHHVIHIVHDAIGHAQETPQ